MRVLAFGGIGSLVAIFALFVVGTISYADPLGGVMLLLCFGGFAIPFGFVLGCLVGAGVGIAARGCAPRYTPVREGLPLHRLRLRWKGEDHDDAHVHREDDDHPFPEELAESIMTADPSKPALPPSA